MNIEIYFNTFLKVHISKKKKILCQHKFSKIKQTRKSRFCWLSSESVKNVILVDIQYFKLLNLFEYSKDNIRNENLSQTVTCGW